MKAELAARLAEVIEEAHREDRETLSDEVDGALTAVLVELEDLSNDDGIRVLCIVLRDALFVKAGGK